MENQLKRSKLMYYYTIVLTILILISNLAVLLFITSLTKPVYTQNIDYGSGIVGTLSYTTPIYPVLKTNQVVLIVALILINIALYGYFLYCFVNNKVKISKVLGIILYAFSAVVSIIRINIISTVLSLLVVGYLLNIKIHK